MIWVKDEQTGVRHRLFLDISPPPLHMLQAQKEMDEYR